MLPATVGIGLPFTFLVACIVVLWIICNEIISIPENIKDMGVPIPQFLTPLIQNIKIPGGKRWGAAGGGY